MNMPQRKLPEIAPITPQDYEKFFEFFYRKTGIVFTDKKAYFVERRLVERIQATGCETFREYFAIVRFQSSGDEWQQLVNSMTVNETYFFREDYQFDAMVQGMLPEITRDRRKGSAVRIWSTPCSTGEEPYSIAIHLLENWKRADDFDIEIHASDIDTRVVAQARRGIYGHRSLQRLSATLRSKYFTALGDDQFRIREELRDSIDFDVANIVDPANMTRFRGMDVIFCRNLLIYFDDVSRRESVELLYECLNPGGFICLGHSESMARISSLFRPRKFADTIVYQKVGSGA
ncbi:chemotaxis protein methyltransferase CheR [Rhodoblastus acidophilus]|uniref:CheR family methyltransferase n=1 Tax=Rhodoblastus acidophilus TaxID=1074 RepID=UPI002224414A|nr:protein-glutamate O-methyltransferase CheR [Rhodoblastus acidophilus]MCW2284098.1 chemotaxis protein methyltransferase CheR [Rhodoblastus acidophilus]MCW2332794.1 chemotaxis protein methyltransferase CheR [Rhodoblastus acidophilus]